MAAKGITQKESEIVLQRNLQNIVAKVADGKVLTTAEIDLLNAQAKTKGGAPAKGEITVVELAKNLGITPKTIYSLRANHDGPQSVDLDEWRAFLESRAIGQDGTGMSDIFLPEELQRLRAKLLRAQAGKEDAVRKLREIELKQKTEGLVPMGEARKAVRRVLGPLRELLDAMPKAAGGKCNPTDPVHAECAMREHLDGVFKQMEKTLDA